MFHVDMAKMGISACLSGVVRALRMPEREKSIGPAILSATQGPEVERSGGCSVESARRRKEALNWAFL